VVNGSAFSHAENSWRVEFAGISFKEEKALRYKYRLLGLDERWQEPTDQRAVNYASLSPGNYTFEVNAINVDGVESAAPAALTFTILPPLWQRWWFMAMSLAFLGAMLYSVHRLRVRRLLEIERIRSRIATDLHDDIGAGLTHIGLLSQVALYKPAVQQFRLDRDFGETSASSVESLGRAARRGQRNDDASPEASNGQTASLAVRELSTSMERVGSIARELSAAMSDVFWSINPKHDSVEALQRRLGVFAHEICSAKGIALQLEVSETMAGMKLHPEIRRNLLLIAKEALHNAAKYSGSPTASVKFDFHAKNFIVAIADQGKGFDVANAKNGHGLANMHTRAEKLGGACEITSEPGKGTRVTAIVPYR
jgi:signal transduction histidine kinase